MVVAATATGKYIEVSACFTFLFVGIRWLTQDQITNPPALFHKKFASWPVLSQLQKENQDGSPLCA